MTLTDELTETIERIARGVGRAYDCEREDVQQELYAWSLEHPKAVERNLKGGDIGMWRLGKALWAAGQRYALKEKADRLGYSVDDQFFYRTEQIESVLPYALGVESFADVQLGVSLEPTGGGGLASEGGNLLAMVIDVQRALKGLEAEDYDYLLEAAQEGCDWDAIGEMRGVLPHSAYKRHHSIVKRLQKELGGPSPWTEYTGSRKSISNATAVAITSKQETGS